MSTLTKLIAASALAFVVGTAHASTPCNGFEIKIKNNLADDLLVNEIDLQGAEIQPHSFQKLNAKSEQVFTVNGSRENQTMVGRLEFHTISLPSKTVVIRFDLDNKTIFCSHTDKDSSGDYPVANSRLPGKVTYTIGK